MLIVYSKPICPRCDALKRKLDKENIPFETRDITRDEKAYDDLKNRGLRSLPVISFNGEYASGEFQGDENYRRILKQAAENNSVKKQVDDEETNEEIDLQHSAPSM